MIDLVLWRYPFSCKISLGRVMAVQSFSPWEWLSIMKKAIRSALLLFSTFSAFFILSYKEGKRMQEARGKKKGENVRHNK